MSVPGADPRVLGPYLARELGDARWREPTVEVVVGGRSNLTYYVTSPAGSVVLRRPPLRAVRPTAHDMTREHRVLSALHGTAVPVPRPLLLCTDPDVLGAPFYVMERVDGVIARDHLPDGYAPAPAGGSAMTDALVDVLADLHDGRPGRGRAGPASAGRTATWTGSCAAGRASGRRCARATTCPAVDALAAELVAKVPREPSGPVVHGDYRLDNVVLDPADPAPGRGGAGLGDVHPRRPAGRPRAAARLLAAGRRGTVVTPSVTSLPGFPGRSALVARYAARRDVDLAALPWYVALGCFKLAVVVAGIVARQRAGAMVDNTDDGLGARIGPLAEAGRSALAGGLDEPYGS